MHALITRIAQDIVDSAAIDARFDVADVELDPAYQRSMLSAFGDEVAQCDRCGRVVAAAELEEVGGVACCRCRVECENGG